MDINVLCFLSLYFDTWDIEKYGDTLYEIIPSKMRDGCVYPRGWWIYFLKITLKYGTGNIAALKNEVSKENPVIVMIRIQTNKNWLHYVLVVGYDEQYTFIAELLVDFVNSNE